MEGRILVLFDTTVNFVDELLHIKSNGSALFLFSGCKTPSYLLTPVFKTDCHYVSMSI